MIEHFEILGSSFRQFIAVMAYHAPRTMAFLVFFPAFSGSILSNLLKMSIGSALILYPSFTALIAYKAESGAAASMTIITFASEVCLGALLGLTIALPYYAFRAMGALIDVYRGATFSAQVSGNDNGEQLPVETLFGLLFIAHVATSPGLHGITVHLLHSYLQLPPGTLALQGLEPWLTTLVRLFADHITFGFLLSAPVLIIVLLVELIIEIVSAFTPQMQIYSLEYGLRSLLGIGMLLLIMEFASAEIFVFMKEYLNILESSLEALQ